MGGGVIYPPVKISVSQHLSTVVPIFTLLTLSYIVAYQVAKNSIIILPPVAAEFCSEKESICSRPDLFAFQVASGVAIYSAAAVSILAWYQFKASGPLPTTLEGRMYGWHNYAYKIAVINFTFQLWDFFVSLMIPEHCTAVFLCHHIFAALTAWIAMNNQINIYYGIFYLGLTEVSSTFLVFVDLGKFFPPSEGTLFHLLESMCKYGFAISFVWFRVILWWKISFEMWTDFYHLWKKDDNSEGSYSKMRPGKWYVPFYYIIGSIGFGLLQLFWAMKVLEASAEHLESN